MIDNETEYHSFVYAKNQFCDSYEKKYGRIFTNLNIAKKLSCLEQIKKIQNKIGNGNKIF
jgi:hypothetical protein